jgi:hypothetical protein
MSLTGLCQFLVRRVHDHGLSTDCQICASEGDLARYMSDVIVDLIIFLLRRLIEQPLTRIHICDIKSGHLHFFFDYKDA